MISTPAVDLLVFQCRAIGLPEPAREFRFWPGRRFAFDVAFVEQRLAVEIDGGVFLSGGGRHNRGAGYRRDAVKFAEAAIRGWRVIRCLPEHVKSGAAVSWIERAIRQAEISGLAPDVQSLR